MKRVIDSNFGLITTLVGMLGVGGFVAVRYIVYKIPFSSSAFRPLWVSRPLMSDPTTLNRLYGRRQGHKLRTGQAQLLEQLLPQIVVPEEGPVTYRPLFGADRHLHFGLGFGSGEHLAYRAALLPDHGFLVCAPFLNGAIRAITKIP